MAKRRYTSERIINKLREAEVLLNQQGWKANHKRVERIWRREGLKVSKKQPKRGRLWLNDGSCIRLKISNIKTMWKASTLWRQEQLMREARILTLIDEYTRECLTILTQRRITSGDVIEQLFYLFVFRSLPQHILI